jgi:hypothetical protein
MGDLTVANDVLAVLDCEIELRCRAIGRPYFIGILQYSTAVVWAVNLGVGWA